jgi:5'-nucleotidase
LKNFKVTSTQIPDRKRMHILVTNDDGIYAPGLLALTQAMRVFGKVSVVAPDRNWSISGHVKTLHRPIRVSEVSLADGTPALATDGAPSDCVALPLLGLLEEPIDLVVSGINPYPNLGHDLTYSGTVTSAMEAAIWKIPAAAFSLNGIGTNLDRFHFDTAGQVAQVVVQRIISHGLPEFTLLNVNIPDLPLEQIKGYEVTRQGMRIYNDVLGKRQDEQGAVQYWIEGDPPTGLSQTGTDYGALSEGIVSVHPVHLDLTAYGLMKQLRQWEWPVPPTETRP